MKLIDILLDQKAVKNKAEYLRFLEIGAIKLNSIPLELEHAEIIVKPKDVIDVGTKIRMHFQDNGSVRYLRTRCV